MLYRGPMGGGAASGAAGALVAAHNAGGQYLRSRTTPTNPSSSYQIGVRNALSTLATLWSTVLTASQRAAWTTFGATGSFINRLGDPIQLSGISAFLRNNAQRVAAGFAYIADGPPVPTGTPIYLPVMTATAPDTLSLNFSDNLTNDAPWPNDDDGHLLVYVSRPQSPAVNFYVGPYRLLGTVDGDAVTPPTSPAAFTYAGLGFGPLTAGGKLFVRYVAVTGDGSISPVVRASTVIL